MTADLGTLTFIAFSLALFSGGCLLMALSLYLLKLWDARKQQQSMNATYDEIMTLCDRQNREEIASMLRRMDSRAISTVYSPSELLYGVQHPPKKGSYHD